MVLYQLYVEKVCKVGSNWFGDGKTFDDYTCDHLDSGNFTEAQGMTMPAPND